MKYLLLILTFLCLNSSYSQAPNDPLLNYLKEVMEVRKIPGLQAIVIEKGKIVFSEALGKASISFNVPVNKNTLFSINSIGKIFTSTAVMQLIEQKKLDLNNPISVYLKDIPKNWYSVTIKELLSHTSGLPNIEDPDTEDLIGNRGIENAWKKVKQMPIEAEPGEVFNYNATNYLLLYKIITDVSHQTFEGFIQKNQFKIAGMQHIKYGNSSDVIENNSPTYSYYHLDKESGEYFISNSLITLNESFPKQLWTDSGAFTTSTDLAKWVLALLNGKFVNEQNLQTMWDPVPQANGEYKGLGGILNAYALGWPVVKRKNHPAVSPLGGGRASIFIYPNDELCVILLTNLMGSYPHEIADKISHFYL